VRHASLQATSRNSPSFSAILFGQIFEAKHEPEPSLQHGAPTKVLQETTDEMARNGCKKILIVNGHGGNEHLLPFFAQASSISRMTTSFTCSTASAVNLAARKKNPPASITTR